MAYVNKTKRLFIEMLNPYKNSLYRFCKRVIWNANDVEDALQTTIMNAYKSFDKFEEVTNFKAWIFKYLINTVFNFNKKHSRLTAIETSVEEIQDKEPIIHSGHESLDFLEILERENIYHEILKNPFKLLEDMDKPVKDSLNKLSVSEKTFFSLNLS